MISTDPHPHRWRATWTGFAILAICGGLHFFIFPIVMEAMRAEFNATLTAISATIFVWGVVGAIASPPIGAAIDRFGPRAVLVAGTVLQALAFAVVAAAPSLIWVYIGFGLAAIALCANTYIAVAAAVAELFVKDRGKAMGIAMLGLGVGGLIWPNVTQRLLAHDWHTVYWVYAAVVTLMLPVIWWGMQAAANPAGSGSAEKANEDSVEAKTVTETGLSLVGQGGMLRTRSFWGLALGDGLTGLIFAFFTVHFIGFSTEAGVSAATAAAFFGIFLFLSSPGTFVLGVLADRYSVRTLTLLCYGLPVLLIPALFGLPSLLFLGLFALVPGFLAGGRTAMFPLAIGYSFGQQNVARVFGWLNIAFMLGNAVGPVFSGVLHDRSGNYQSSIWASWLLGGIALGLVALIRREKSAET